MFKRRVSVEHLTVGLFMLANPVAAVSEKDLTLLSHLPLCRATDDSLYCIPTHIWYRHVWFKMCMDEAVGKRQIGSTLYTILSLHAPILSNRLSATSQNHSTFSEAENIKTTTTKDWQARRIIVPHLIYYMTQLWAPLCPLYEACCVWQDY